MTSLVECDFCKKVASPVGLLGWKTIRSHMDAISVGRMGESPQEPDLCSWRCVMLYGRKMTEEG